MPVQFSSPDFSDYEFTGTFALPETASSNYPLFDVLSDGRIISTDGVWVYVEKSLGSRDFEKVKELGNVPYPAYIRVSPSGKIAVDKGGTVSIFNFDTPESEVSYDLGAGYDAEWIDDERLAVTGVPSNGITALNVSNGSKVQLIKNIGGYPAGVTIDSSNRLYCANGGDLVAGGTQTGWIKTYSQDQWEAALASGDAIDFETTGILVADLLSAGYLEFDGLENLLIGGGVFFTASGDEDGSNEPSTPDSGYAAIVNGDAIKAALAGGPVVVRSAGSNTVHEFDPIPGSNKDSYYLNANRVSQELYLSDYGGDATGGDNAVVYVFGRKPC